MKVWNYIFISITLMMVFTIAGFPTPMTGSLKFIGVHFDENGTTTNVNFSGSDLYNYMWSEAKDLGSGGDDSNSNLGWLALLGAGIAVGGLFWSGQGNIALKGGFAGAVFLGFMPILIYPLWYAITAGYSAWVIGILTVIFVPYTVMFVVSLVEWVAGGTSD